MNGVGIAAPDSEEVGRMKRARHPGIRLREARRLTTLERRIDKLDREAQKIREYLDPRERHLGRRRLAG